MTHKEEIYELAKDVSTHPLQYDEEAIRDELSRAFQDLVALMYRDDEVPKEEFSLAYERVLLYIYFTEEWLGIDTLVVRNGFNAAFDLPEDHNDPEYNKVLSSRMQDIFHEMSENDDLALEMFNDCIKTYVLCGVLILDPETSNESLTTAFIDAAIANLQLSNFFYYLDKDNQLEYERKVIDELKAKIV